MPDIGHAAWEQAPRLRPRGAIVVQHAPDRGALGRIDAVPPRRIVRHAIGRVRGHEDGRGAIEQAQRIAGGCRIATQESMATQDESVPPHDVGGAGFDDCVLVGPTGGGLGAQRPELVRRPERRHIEAVGMQLLEHVDVPFEVQFADTVVRDRKCLGVGVCGEIEVVALDCDQMAPVRVDDAERDVESLRLLDRLIAGDDAAVPIGSARRGLRHGRAGTVRAPRAHDRYRGWHCGGPLGDPAAGAGDGRIVSIWAYATLLCSDRRFDDRCPRPSDHAIFETIRDSAPDLLTLGNATLGLEGREPIGQLRVEVEGVQVSSHRNYRSIDNSIVCGNACRPGGVMCGQGSATTVRG